MTRKEWFTRMTGLLACMVLAGCMGSTTSDPAPEEGPDVIVDQPDPETPETPIEEEEEEEDIVDIITDVVTTSVSVTTITATGGS